jgi:hypothetical protein
MGAKAEVNREICERHEMEKSTEANEGKEGNGFNREWTPMDANGENCRRINHKERKEHKDGERAQGSNISVHPCLSVVIPYCRGRGHEVECWPI